MKNEKTHLPKREPLMKCQQQPKFQCKWPRCDCPVDLVYMTDCFIPRPGKR